MQDIPVEKVIQILQRASDWHKINHNHGVRVRELASALGARYGLSGESLQHLDYAAGLHDIGRLGVDDEIMSKPSELTQAQRGAMEKHPQIGYELIRDAFPEDIALAVLHHHEKWDGTGYPKGLYGEAIPLFARIIRIADHWDALTNDRPYRKALTRENSLHIMNLERNYFDPQVYAVFLEILREAE